MHLNSGDLQRPQLFAGDSSTTLPKSGRILADMEGQRTPHAAQTTARAPRTRWGLAAGAFLLGSAALGLGIWALHEPAPSATKTTLATPPAMPQSQSPLQPPAAPAGTAVIVDAVDTHAVASTASPDARAAAPEPPSSPTGVAQPAATAISQPLDRIAVRSQASRASKPAHTARRSDSNRREADQKNLLGTLMGLIEGPAAPAAGTPPRAPQTMDELVAKLDADQRQQAETERNAFKAVSDKQAEAVADEGKRQLKSAVKNKIKQ